MATEQNKNKKYIILRTLGRGSFGKVKEALHVMSGEKIAIKILEKARIKKDDDLTRIKREINILNKVNHPNIVQLFEIIETNKYFFFVMEYAQKGELSYYIEKQKKLTEMESCKFFQQLISGVSYLHKIGCAHRDIKPSNILIDSEYNLRIIDFGLGNLYSDDEKLKTACGSPCYAAPEIISGERYNPITVDIWSSGITLFAMLCGYLPFDEESKSLLYQKILTCDYAIPSHVSSEAVDLLKRILVRNVKKRLTIEQIMQHPWFNLYTPNQVKEGIIVSKTKFPVEIPIAKLAAKKMDVSAKYVHKMIEDNDKNKYTTLYHLLKRRYDRGDLPQEELIFSPKPEKMPEESKEESDSDEPEDPSHSQHRQEEQSISHNSHQRNPSTHSHHSQKRPSKSKPSYTKSKRYKSNDRYPSGSTGNRSRYSRDDDQQLPNIKPNVTVNDITVEVKEKITINTTVDGRSQSPTNKTHYTKRNFYLSGRGYEVRNRGNSRMTPKSNMGIKIRGNDVTITTDYSALNNQTALSKDLESSNDESRRRGTPTYKSQARYNPTSGAESIDSHTHKNHSKKKMLNMMLQRMISSKKRKSTNKNLARKQFTGTGHHYYMTPKYGNERHQPDKFFKNKGNLSLSIDHSRKHKNSTNGGRRRNVSHNHGGARPPYYFTESPKEESSRNYKIGKWDHPPQRGASSKSKASKKRAKHVGGGPDKIVALRKNKQLKIRNIKLRNQLHAYVGEMRDSKSNYKGRKSGNPST